jgi:hypothetical protein
MNRSTQPNRPPLVFQIGATNGNAILAAARVLVGHSPVDLEGLRREFVSELLYEGVNSDLGVLLDEFRAGSFASINIKPVLGPFSWLLLFEPNFDSDSEPWWSLVAEYDGDQALELAEQVRRVRGLDFIVLSIEDSLDDMPIPLTPLSFPWNDYRLVVAGVAEPGESMTFRKGHAYASISTIE